MKTLRAKSYLTLFQYITHKNWELVDKSYVFIAYENVIIVSDIFKLLWKDDVWKERLVLGNSRGLPQHQHT